MCAFVLAVAGLAPCAGWQATPEARRACCAPGGGCAGHESQSNGQASGTFVSQTAADNCCATSQRSDSSPVTSSAVPAVTLAILSTPVPTLQPERIAYREGVPWPGHRHPSPVPKHLLLSVFIV